MSENAKKKPYIVRVPVRGIMSKTFDSWEKAMEEVDRIQIDMPTQEQLAEAGYKLVSMAFPNKAPCRPQWMFYGKEEDEND